MHDNPDQAYTKQPHQQLSKKSRSGDEIAREQLLDKLANISNDDVLPVARAFSHFLNLKN